MRKYYTDRQGYLNFMRGQKFIAFGEEDKSKSEEIGLYSFTIVGPLAPKPNWASLYLIDPKIYQISEFNTL